MKPDISFDTASQANLPQGSCSVSRSPRMSQFCSLKCSLPLFGIKDRVLERGHEEGHFMDEARFLRDTLGKSVEYWH